MSPAVATRDFSTHTAHLSVFFGLFHGATDNIRCLLLSGTAVTDL